MNTIEFIGKNHVYMTLEEMSQALSLPVKVVIGLGTKEHYINRYSWSDKEKLLMRDLYGKIKIIELQKKLNNRNIPAIQKYANRMRLKGNQSIAQKIYNINQEFFDNPNIQNSYWAGFIAADGYLGKDGNVKIALSSKDIEILYNFQYQIEYDGKIKHFTAKGKKYSEISLWGMHQWRKKLKEYWNIIPENKSIKLKPPISLMSKDCIYSYIIGYWDGDGCFWYGTRGLNTSVCGTFDVIEWIRHYIVQLLGIDYHNKIGYNGISKSNFKVNWAGKRAFSVRNGLENIVDIDWKLTRKWYK